MAEWPRELVDAVNRVGVEKPLTCGQNKCGFKMGCDEPLDDPNDRYKCVDCDVEFHRPCARRHFLDSGDRCENLRKRFLDIIDAFRRRADLEPQLGELLDAFEKEAIK